MSDADPAGGDRRRDRWPLEGPATTGRQAPRLGSTGLELSCRALGSAADGRASDPASSTAACGRMPRLRRTRSAWPGRTSASRLDESRAPPWHPSTAPDARRCDPSPRLHERLAHVAQRGRHWDVSIARSASTARRSRADVARRARVGTPSGCTTSERTCACDWPDRRPRRGRRLARRPACRHRSVRRCYVRTDAVNSLDHWGYSSAGRARGWQPQGQGFEPPQLHFRPRPSAWAASIGSQDSTARRGASPQSCSSR